MTTRRRFFPARSAQTVPGATARVQVQLQPAGRATAPVPAPAAAPAAFTADIAGPALLPEWRYMVGTTRKKVPLAGGENYLDYDWGEGIYWRWEEVEENSICHGSGYVLPGGAPTGAWCVPG